jgi:hypothetical protein
VSDRLGEGCIALDLHDASRSSVRVPADGVSLAGARSLNASTIWKGTDSNPAGAIMARPSDRLDPRIDSYVGALPEWQQQICLEVSDLVHAADPEVEETIKRSRQPYFVLEGNICALLAARDHVNVFLYDGGIVPDPDVIIT